jgi:hypothetical protein
VRLAPKPVKPGGETLNGAAAGEVPEDVPDENGEPPKPRPRPAPNAGGAAATGELPIANANGEAPGAGAVAVVVAAVVPTVPVVPNTNAGTANEGAVVASAGGVPNWPPEAAKRFGAGGDVTGEPENDTDTRAGAAFGGVAHEFDMPGNINGLPDEAEDADMVPAVPVGAARNTKGAAGVLAVVPNALIVVDGLLAPDGLAPKLKEPPRVKAGAELGELLVLPAMEGNGDDAGVPNAGVADAGVPNRLVGGGALKGLVATVVDIEALFVRVGPALGDRDNANGALTGLGAKPAGTAPKLGAAPKLNKGAGAGAGGVPPPPPNGKAPKPLVENCRCMAGITGAAGKVNGDDGAGADGADGVSPPKGKAPKPLVETCRRTGAVGAGRGGVVVPKAAKEANPKGDGPAELPPKPPKPPGTATGGGVMPPNVTVDSGANK